MSLFAYRLQGVCSLSVLSRALWRQKKTLLQLPPQRPLSQRLQVKESLAPLLQSSCRTTWPQYDDFTLSFHFWHMTFSQAVLILIFLAFFFFLLFSCGQNCRHKRSSSLPPCFMNTATDPPSMSSALTFGNSMGTAGSSFYLVWTLFSFLSDFQCSAFVFCLMIWTGLILNYGYTGVFSATL